jgi:diguanylate cyclase (GGDEF)-like protein/PAS domain S-box-containing protein
VFQGTGADASRRLGGDGVRVEPELGCCGSDGDEHLAALALSVAPLATAVLDGDGRVRCANQAFGELTGRAGDALAGVPLSALVVPTHRLLVRSALAEARRGDRGPEPPVLRVAPASADRWAQLHVARLPAGPDVAAGAPAAATPGFVVQLVDVTEQRLQERRLHDLAFRDPLTQVLSRRGIERAIGTFCERAERGDQHAALLAIDLDRFKDVNDTLGHPVGDTVLARVATEMRRRLRPKDLVGRLGGDEFVVLLPSCQLADAARVADGLLQAVAGGLEALAAEGAGGERGFEARSVTASVGIAAFDCGRSAEAVMAAADRALYAAKRRGGNCWAHDPGPGGPHEHRDCVATSPEDEPPQPVLASPRR